ncbi:MAG: S-methyl-5-thioribose-1-phosphate isomerase [Planctomycetota bacterium]|nr:MAG: S-methyl-5-thioribose-1-phosphate isomerase [Planctomycetota bacterium]
MDIRAVRWEGGPLDGGLFILDQTRLPVERREMRIDSLAVACEAVASLRVRGAPLLGVFGLYALVVGLRERLSASDPLFAAAETAAELKAVRPTAVNLAAELDRFLRRLHSERPASVEEACSRALEAAAALQKRDEENCLAIARAGLPHVEDGGLYTTHCNTGSLATAGIGTALGVFKLAWREGKRFELLVPETRPLLQGSRLTAWELTQAGIPFRLVCEGALAAAYRELPIRGCVVGADRIARNGDTANKVGTLLHAKLCAERGIPFHVAAPLSTFDPHCRTGADIPVEFRGDSELRGFGSAITAPAGARAWNPAFDVTPGALVTSFVTDAGLFRSEPEALASLFALVEPA